MDLNACIAYATEKHKGQTRRQGTPYIEHPLWVMNYLQEQGASEATLAAAVFHDLLEDTDATEQELIELSSEEVLAAVRLLTKYPGYDADAYYAAILANPIAKAVKAADRMHNLISLYELSPEETSTVKFVRKYLKETKERFAGQFGAELDECYARCASHFASMLSKEA